MNIFETIAERRIRAAREAGFFDNLPGAGKPIPDLDHERPPGWWATRLVRRERSMMRFEDLNVEIRSAMPDIWRLDSEGAVRDRVDELNNKITEYNRATTWDRRDPLDVDQIVEQWRELRQRPRRP